MRLDATTLAITTVALTGVVAAILFAARRRYDDGIRDSLSIWAGALLCLMLSASLFIRPLSSTLAVILVGNSALVAGYTGFVLALRRNGGDIAATHREMGIVVALCASSAAAGIGWLSGSAPIQLCPPG